MMTSKELYEGILGLKSPWMVELVELKTAEKEVRVVVRYREGSRFVCPECGKVMPLYDHRDRRWRHLDTCQMKTMLEGRFPRVECVTHGVLDVAVPWAEKGSRWTLMFETFAIMLLEDSDVTAAATALRISWEGAWAIAERAVARGLDRRRQVPLQQVLVDEKAFRKGHEYVTLVANTGEQGAKVEFIAEGRDTEALASFWKAQSPARLEQVEAVAMDLHRPYWEATVAHVPGAVGKIVHDRFHLMKHVQDGLNTVRKQEHRMLQAEGFDLLKSTKYLWLKNPDDWTPEQKHDFKAIKIANLMTSKAWAMKETIRHLWSYRSVGVARKFFKKWARWVRRSKLAPMMKVADMFQRHLENILTFCKHRLTTAALEAINAKIALVKKRSRGIANVSHLKTLIYFHCGGLDLNPSSAHS
jgi:transposase